MNGEIRSLNDFRLKARESGYGRETGYDEDVLNEMQQRVERRSPQAGRLVATLNGCVKNPRRRALIQYSLLSALELLPLESVSEEGYLPALRIWYFGREGSDSQAAAEDPGLTRMVEDGQAALRSIDPAFAEAHDFQMCLRLTGDERRLVRRLFAVIARAAMPNQKP